jgi:cytidylate kinase
MRELESRGMQASFDDVLSDIHARDERDSTRETAPLRQAADALLLDTSAMDVDEAISEALRLVADRLATV